MFSSKDEKLGEKKLRKQGDAHSVLHIYPDYILLQKGESTNQSNSSNQIKQVSGSASGRNWK